MKARIFSKTGDTRGTEVKIAGEAIIGRDPQSDLVIDQPLMSSRHARVFYDEDKGCYQLEDLDSLNGTQLDGDAIRGSEPLRHLHVITFAGSYDFFFQDLERSARRHADRPRPARDKKDEPAPIAASQTESQEVTAVEQDPVGLPGFLARRADAVSGSISPPSPKDVTKIEQQPVILPGELANRVAGPAKDADAPDEAPAEAHSGTIMEKLPVVMPGNLAKKADKVATVDLADIEDLITSDGELPAELEGSAELLLVVTESGGRVHRFDLAEGKNHIGRGSKVEISLDYPDLSRRHALIEVDGDTVKLRDLGSRNRTFIEDEPLDAEVDVEIRPGTRVRFGSVEARLVQLGGGSR